jgi:hypothetical protein
MWLKAQDNPNYKISEKGSYKWNRNIGKELEIQEREMPENKKLLQQLHTLNFILNFSNSVKITQHLKHAVTT